MMIPQFTHLSEGGSAHDRRLVDLRVLADLVAGAVGGDGADGLGAADGARVVGVVLHDVVLGQWAVEPACCYVSAWLIWFEVKVCLP